MRFSNHSMDKLEKNFRLTFPDAEEAAEDAEYHRQQVREMLSNPDRRDRELFEIHPGAVFSKHDGREITNTVQLAAERFYWMEVGWMNEYGGSQFIHDEEEQAFYHREFGDLVLSRYTFNLSLLLGGKHRGMYANHRAGPKRRGRGG